MLVFDYNKAIAQVRELRSIAVDMQNLRNRMLADAIQNMKASWKGPTSDLFHSKCEKFAGIINTEINNIRSIADNLELTSKTIEAAERAAVSKLVGGSGAGGSKGGGFR